MSILDGPIGIEALILIIENLDIDFDKLTGDEYVFDRDKVNTWLGRAEMKLADLRAQDMKRTGATWDRHRDKRGVRHRRGKSGKFVRGRFPKPKSRWEVDLS